MNRVAIKAEPPRPAARRAHERERKTARQQRWRRRQRAGVAVYAVPLDHKTLNGMIDVGLLAAHESDDVVEVVKAIGDLIRDYLNARGV